MSRHFPEAIEKFSEQVRGAARELEKTMEHVDGEPATVIINITKGDSRPYLKIQRVLADDLDWIETDSRSDAVRIAKEILALADQLSDYCESCGNWLDEGSLDCCEQPKRHEEVGERIDAMVRAAEHARRDLDE